MTRSDGRSFDAIRPITVETGFQKFPEGSVLYRCGETRVLCSASIDENVPGWMRGKGRGWVTGEYAMHPRANPQRQDRDSRRGKLDGRVSEIQRLIGRALRSAVRLEKLGERQIIVDCDVLDADGGTRTASITGGWIALVLALDSLRKRGLVAPGVLRAPVCAISVGLVEGKPMADLAYTEDSAADVDLNVVSDGAGGIIEVQGTAEGAPVPRASFDSLVDLALAAMPALRTAQDAALAKVGVDAGRLS